MNIKISDGQVNSEQSTAGDRKIERRIIDFEVGPEVGVPKFLSIARPAVRYRMIMMRLLNVESAGSGPALPCSGYQIGLLKVSIGFRR